MQDLGGYEHVFFDLKICALARMSNMARLRACTQVCGKEARARMTRRKNATTKLKPSMVLGSPRSSSPSVARGAAALGAVMPSMVNRAFTIVRCVGAWRLLGAGSTMK